MRVRLYVGNLRCANESLLMEHLSAHVEVLAIHIAHQWIGQTRSAFAFVDVGSTADAERIMSLYNNRDFCGSELIVEIARGEEPSSRRTSAVSEEVAA